MNNVKLVKNDIKNTKMLYELEKKELNFRYGKKNIPRREFPTMYEYLKWAEKDEEKDYRNYKKSKKEFEKFGDYKKAINKIDKFKNRFVSESKDQHNIQNFIPNIKISNLNPDLPIYYKEKEKIDINLEIKKDLKWEHVDTEYKQEIAVIKDNKLINIEDILNKNKLIDNKQLNENKEINKNKSINKDDNKTINKKLDKTKKIKKANTNLKKKNDIKNTKNIKNLKNNKNSKNDKKTALIKKKISPNKSIKISPNKNIKKSPDIELKLSQNKDKALSPELNYTENIFIKEFEERLNKTKTLNPKIYKYAPFKTTNIIPYAGKKLI